VKKRPAANQLHAEEDIACFRDYELIELNQVRMLEVGEGTELLFEAEHRSGTGLEHRLHGDRALCFAIEHLIHASHATFAKQLDHLVARRASPLGRRRRRRDERGWRARYDRCVVVQAFEILNSLTQARPSRPGTPEPL
jgi:hypothetical protein